MRITTDRLILREITIDDAGYVLSQLNDPGWLKYIGDRGVRTLEEAETYIRDKILTSHEDESDSLMLVTELKKDPSLGAMGQCGLFKRKGLDHLDIGFAFLEPNCGKGYGYEASSTVLELAKKKPGIDCLGAITTEDNIASQKLLEKLGLSYLKTIMLPDIEGPSMYYEIRF